MCKLELVFMRDTEMVSFVELFSQCLDYSRMSMTKYQSEVCAPEINELVAVEIEEATTLSPSGLKWIGFEEPYSIVDAAWHDKLRRLI
jgi:hypothetical protein